MPTNIDPRFRDTKYPFLPLRTVKPPAKAHTVLNIGAQAERRREKRRAHNKAKAANIRLGS